MATNEDKAADRWYRRYLELQERKRAEPPATAPAGDIEAALRQVERRMRDMNVQMYGGGRRVSGMSGKRAMLAKQRARLLQAQRERARQVYTRYQRSGAPFSLAVEALANEISVPVDEARDLLEQVRMARQMAGAEREMDAFADAVKAMAVGTSSGELAKRLLGEFKDEPDTRGPLEQGKGRRPQPAIVQVKVATFRVTEWAAKDAGRYDQAADWVKERKGIHVQDIDGTEVYVAVEAVQRQVAAGRVPGYAALTPEEADSLHLVLVEAEHYQQALLKQAMEEGDHDPAEVLRVSRANGAQAAYRKRLGLPLHAWTEECCGQWVAPVTKEASE